MKFALINGQRTEPQPKLKGICINCQSETISKCGKIKIWHWAHKSKISCDPWWENETEWHRAWKNLFPVEWQENIHVDTLTGEKHIADVKTSGGLVIEFQHSAIQETEVKSREAFYKNMVWVVDGARLKRDYPRFWKAFQDFKPRHINLFFMTAIPEKFFPPNWLKSSVPVYFDFQNIPLAERVIMKQETFWCLFPSRIEGHAIFAAVSPEEFLKLCSGSSDALFARNMPRVIGQLIREERSKRQSTLYDLRDMNRPRYRRHRRF